MHGFYIGFFPWSLAVCEEMFSRSFKNMPNNISMLGVGTMRFPQKSNDSADIDYDKAQEIVDYAIENGVNYFDTAYFYHNGESERCIAKLLAKYPRESYYLADKLPAWQVESMEDVKRVFNEQLEKCQTEYFDFYLCHSIGRDQFEKYDRLPIIEYLHEMKLAGKIGYLGFSFHDSPDILAKFITRYPFDFVQIQLNYLDYEMQDAKRQYEILSKSNLPCIVMEPVRGGLLADLNAEANAILKAENEDMSIASWAIRYAASFDNVLTVLSGMSTYSQVVDNVKSLKNFSPLTEIERAALEKAKNIFKTSVSIPCTACKYCIDCPKGIDIPSVFKMYNDFAVTKNTREFKRQFDKLQNKDCIACKRCESHCPQGIKISEQFEKFARIEG